MPRRRPLPLLALALAAAGLAGACTEDRDRYNVPSIAVQPDSVLVVGADHQTLVYAADASGVIYVGARLYCGDSVVARDRINLPRTDTVVVRFRFRVSPRVPAGAQVFVEAEAIDDQSFSRIVRDTVVARATADEPAGDGTACTLLPPP